MAVGDFICCQSIVLTQFLIWEDDIIYLLGVHLTGCSELMLIAEYSVPTNIGVRFPSTKCLQFNVAAVQSWNLYALYSIQYLTDENNHFCTIQYRIYQCPVTNTVRCYHTTAPVGEWMRQFDWRTVNLRLTHFFCYKSSRKLSQKCNQQPKKNLVITGHCNIPTKYL